MRTFKIGETVEVYVEVKTQAGVLVDPSGCDAGEYQCVTVTIIDPDGTIAEDSDENDIEDTVMSRLDTGKYAYYYTIKSTDAKGWWRTPVKAQDGAIADPAKYTIIGGGFKVEG